MTLPKGWKKGRDSEVPTSLEFSSLGAVILPPVLALFVSTLPFRRRPRYVDLESGFLTLAAWCMNFCEYCSIVVRWSSQWQLHNLLRRLKKIMYFGAICKLWIPIPMKGIIMILLESFPLNNDSFSTCLLHANYIPDCLVIGGLQGPIKHSSCP